MEKAMVRLRVLGGVLAIAMAVSLGNPAAAETKLVFAAAQTSIGSLAIFLAKEKGFFKAEGIDADIVDFKGGGPAVQGLAGGGAQFCICPADHPVRLQSHGLPARILTALTEFHGYGLVALADSPVTDIKSLKGQRVGITSPGSLSDNTLRFYVEQAGLNPSRDLEILGIGTGAAMGAAIDSKSVAAGMLTTPDVQAFLAKQGKYKLVHDFRGLRYAALDLLVMESWMKAHDAETRGVAKAVVKAQGLIKTDPAAVRAELHAMYPNFDDALLTEVATEAHHALSTDGRLDRDGYKTMQDMLLKADPTLKPVAYEDVVALDYLPSSAK
jgi:NitT/TauT family transport system substrate-binding protein